MAIRPSLLGWRPLLLGWRAGFKRYPILEEVGIHGDRFVFAALRLKEPILKGSQLQNVRSLGLAQQWSDFCALSTLFRSCSAVPLQDKLYKACFGPRNHRMTYDRSRIMWNSLRELAAFETWLPNARLRARRELPAEDAGVVGEESFGNKDF